MPMAICLRFASMPTDGPHFLSLTPLNQFVCPFVSFRLLSRFLDSAILVVNSASIAGFDSPDTRFVVVVACRIATPDFLNKLPRLNLSVCVLSARVLAFNLLCLLKFLSPVC